MKLRKILPYLDFASDVIIWENISTASDNWEITFRGSILEIPWTYLDRKLIESIDNEGSEAICPYEEDGRVGLRITLAPEED